MQKKLYKKNRKKKILSSKIDMCSRPDMCHLVFHKEVREKMKFSRGKIQF